MDKKQVAINDISEWLEFVYNHISFKTSGIIYNLSKYHSAVYKKNTSIEELESYSRDKIFKYINTDVVNRLKYIDTSVVELIRTRLYNKFDIKICHKYDCEDIHVMCTSVAQLICCVKNILCESNTDKYSKIKSIINNRLVVDADCLINNELISAIKYYECAFGINKFKDYERSDE